MVTDAFFERDGDTVLHTVTNVDELRTYWAEDPREISTLAARYGVRHVNIFFHRCSLARRFSSQRRWQELWVVFELKRHWLPTERAITFIELAMHDMFTLREICHRYPNAFADVRADEFHACFEHRLETFEELCGLLSTSPTFETARVTLFAGIRSQCIVRVKSALHDLPPELVCRVRDRAARSPIEVLLSMAQPGGPSVFFEQCLEVLLPFEHYAKHPLSEVYMMAVQLLRHGPTALLLETFLYSLLPSVKDRLRCLEIPVNRFPLAHQIVRARQIPESDVYRLLRGVRTRPDKYGDTLLSWAMFLHRCELVSRWKHRFADDAHRPDRNGVVPLVHMLRKPRTDRCEQMFVSSFLWDTPWDYFTDHHILRTAHPSWAPILARRGLRVDGVVVPHVQHRHYYLREMLYRAGLRCPLRPCEADSVEHNAVVVDTHGPRHRVTLCETSRMLLYSQIELSSVLLTSIDLDPDAPVVVRGLPSASADVVFSFLKLLEHPHWVARTGSVQCTHEMVPGAYTALFANHTVPKLAAVWFAAHYLDIPRLEHAVRLHTLSKLLGEASCKIRSLCGVEGDYTRSEWALFEYEDMY